MGILTKEDKKKLRDDRTHDQKISELRDAFERLKATANATGLINDCSIKKVCVKANVNDVYLHTEKLKDENINKQYHAVKNEILKFRNNFAKSTIDSEFSLAIKATKMMESERDEAQIQYRGALKQNLELKQKIKVVNKKLGVQNNQAINIAHNNLQEKLSQQNQPTVFTEAKIVSPDTHLYKDGQYSFYDINTREAAWRSVRHEFEKLLKRPIPTRVYMLVGAPCSGKTFWCNESHYYKDKHPVVIDATNLTKSDRSSWFNLIYKYKYLHDIKICAVFFNTPYVVLMERNNMRPPDKRLADDELMNKFKRLEPVDVVNEEFDEIIVVRHYE